jgi:hypothetical protein
LEIAMFVEGYVGTLEAETRGTDRIWFGLTAVADKAEWIKIGAPRAWFWLSLESAERPQSLVFIPILMEAMRSGQQVSVSHQGASPDFHKSVPGDAFGVDGVRALRVGMVF